MNRTIWFRPEFWILFPLTFLYTSNLAPSSSNVYSCLFPPPLQSRGKWFRLHENSRMSRGKWCLFRENYKMTLHAIFMIFSEMLFFTGICWAKLLVSVVAKTWTSFASFCHEPFSFFADVTSSSAEFSTKFADSSHISARYFFDSEADLRVSCFFTRFLAITWISHPFLSSFLSAEMTIFMSLKDF